MRNRRRAVTASALPNEGRQAVFEWARAEQDSEYLGPVDPRPRGPRHLDCSKPGASGDEKRGISCLSNERSQHQAGFAARSLGTFGRACLRSVRLETGWDLDPGLTRRAQRIAGLVEAAHVGVVVRRLVRRVEIRRDQREVEVDLVALGCLVDDAQIKAALRLARGRDGPVRDWQGAAFDALPLGC
jgi:hypothetical protein